METDWVVGEVLQALDRNGIADRTLVVFTTDNGCSPAAGIPALEKLGHKPNGDLRGHKADIYEGGHHVPFIVRWPGEVPAGRTSDDLISQIDLFATIAAIVGFPLPDNAAEDSYDQLPVLKHGAIPFPIRSTHVHNTKAGHYAIRDGYWLLVDAPSGYVSGRNAAWEKKHGYEPDPAKAQLFDLEKDPGQRHNVIAAHPDTAAELRALLARIRSQGHSAPRLDQPQN
jgi:arylsulfatase A